MKNNYRKNAQFMSLRKKLFAAISMLVMSAILMVSASYAWFVMSTAPEVKNIQTQVGANGALEIALMDTDSWNDFDLLDMGDIDESANESIIDSNLKWGNLVNLSSASYGLSKINLMPSRLFIEENGTDESGATQYKINSTILKTPVYGEDGRVVGLDKESTVNFIHMNNMFGTEGYGVRAIGTSSTMSAFQLGMNAAKSALTTNMTAAKTAASNALNQQGGKLASIVVDYSVASKTEGYTDADVQAIKDLALGLQSALNYVETSIRYAFAGYLTTEDAGISTDDYESALAEILDPEQTTLSDLLTTYSGITELIPGLGSNITLLNADQTTVANCISGCDSAINGSDSFTWTQISNLVRPLLDTDQMLIGGLTLDEVRDTVMPGGNVDMAAAFSLVSGGVKLTVPTGSGILSDIADFAGNYTANVTIKDFSYGSYGPLDVDAEMKTATTVSPVYLNRCGNGLKGATVAAAVGSSSITDYYGYAIDLAFRTNAQDSNLQLQTAPAQRIYDDGESAATQGAGSYMKFTTDAGLSATKMIKLMSGIRVVLMDDTQNVLAIAALDCTLGQDAYEDLDVDTRGETGMWSYLNAYEYLGDAAAYQPSDLITEAEYNALPETSTVIFDPVTGAISAKLYLYDFHMTLNSNDAKTGGLTLDGIRADSTITPLIQDSVKRVTAVVYLDGSYVNNSMVAANAVQSMTGVLNLQFSSSATLIPAENSKLRNIGSDEESSEESSASEAPSSGDDPGAGGD